MATVREVVLPHYKKEDGTWNVKIRVTHNRKSAYIETRHFVSVKQLKKGHTIRDPFIIDLVNPILKEYRAKIGELGTRLGFYDARSLAFYLEGGGAIKAEEINVFEFGRDQVARLKQMAGMPAHITCPEYSTVYLIFGKRISCRSLKSEPNSYRISKTI